MAKRDFKNGTATLEEVAEKLASRHGGDAEPVWARYIVNDSTVEKLGELLAGNPASLLLFRDELVAWLRSFDRDGREGDRAFYLEAWNGTGCFTYDRIGRGTIQIPAACVSVFGAIPPELRASSSAKWSRSRMWLRLWITRQCYPQAWFMPLCGASPS